MPQFIDLAQNRKLVLGANGRRYSVTVAPISEKVWFESFFDAIANFLAASHSVTEKQDAVSTAAMSLLEKAAVAAEGYPNLDGVPEWESKIPFKHKETYSNILFETYELDGTRPPPLSSGGTRVVRLQSVWGTGPTGAMRRNRNLAHHFKVPTLEQRQRVDLAYLEVRRLGGFSRRGGPSVSTPSQTLAANTLVPLYNKLISRVEGYCVNGEPLSDNRPGIVENMDTFHKVIAVRPLFAWSQAQIKEMRVM